MNHSELCHKWAHAAPDAARKSGSMSFNGATLYSYATPIARIYAPTTEKDMRQLVLFSEKNYSASTSKHLSHAWRAVSHLAGIRVPCYIIGAGRIGRYSGNGSAAQDHAANLAYLAQSAADHLKAAQRAMTRRNVEWRAEAAAGDLKRWQEYADFFGIRRKCPQYPAGEWAAALQRAQAIEQPDPVRDAKRFKAKQRRERLNAEKMQAAYAARRLAQIDRELAPPDYREGCRRSNWRLDGAFFPMDEERSDPVMLRVNGDDIETSLGARVPLAAAPMVWNLVQRARGAEGFEPSRALGRLKIGDYPLDRIDADGTLRAGCHVIPYSELEVMARSLGLAS